MDFSISEDAVLYPFYIGPSTIVGRTIALRVLFLKATKEELLYVWAHIALYLRRVRKFSSFVYSFLLQCLNPRKPSIILASVLGAAFLLRRARTVKLKAEVSYRRKFWENMMNSVNTYEEWAHAARMLEKNGSRRKDSDFYDEELVRAKLVELRQRRLKGSVEDILFCLRADLVRNLGNMCNPDLHKGRLQTPKLIQEYIEEVRYHLYAVCAKSSEEISLEEKIAFIHETRHAFGRTALLLSGGAALGAFHLGVVRTLVEHRLLPRVIAGASVGSIICSFAATRTWSELQAFFEDPNPPLHFFESMGNIFAIAHRLLTHGAVQGIGQLQRGMRQLIGDLTFQEAYDLSGRVLGISVCSPRRHDPPRCLNYLTSPHVVIWSAVTASCAFPGLFEAQELMAKDRQGRLVPYHSLVHVGQEGAFVARRQWRDGSLESDLPMVHLKELFNVNHFIVSQANPHIAPLLRVKEAVRNYGGHFAGKLAHLVEMEVKHRCRQALELGFPLGGISKLFAQDWEGDITIVMPATIFAKLIQKPHRPSELRKSVLQGRRCTWAKLSAIQANCGIELMLDECMIVLNQQRQLQRNSEKCLTPTGSGPNLSLGSSKRIPSWICLAWENVAGNSEDENSEPTLPAGGPWGGAPLKRSRITRSTNDGSDGESGSDGFDESWTKAGGPFMRSPSANKLIVMMGFDNDAATNEGKESRAGLEAVESSLKS
ncbi:hypothetical protein KP509_09G090200 [Ceratopteris richardii]|uniref:PNPLA domain-containing protein n=1 Tax=Ceratopteris richardii TaxID=49495 RepID=A0A8T2U2B2_CERRI|nr:hypothetical protein KP509_09G090200 [Ceratopteris richardii]